LIKTPLLFHLIGGNESEVGSISILFSSALAIISFGIRWVARGFKSGDVKRVNNTNDEK
jgi:hypothetical protein